MEINEVNLMKQIERINTIMIIAASSESSTKEILEILDNSVRVCNFALKALKLERVSQGLVNKSNVVTAYWRHNKQELIDDEMMVELYDRQLETEAALQEYRNGQRTNQSTERSAAGSI